MKKNSLVLVLISLASASAFAAAAGEGIPWGKLIIPQAVNVTLFLGVLIYLTKDIIVGHFSSKRTNFEAAQNAAAKAKADAEKQFSEMRSKIDNLQTTADAEKQKAVQSAAELKDRLVASAQSQAEKLIADAEVAAGAELQRAVLTLRTETISKSSEVAEAQMKTSADPKTLQKAFVSQVQGAQL